MVVSTTSIFDVLDRSVLAVCREKSFPEAIRTMRLSSSSSVIVTSDENPVGIVTLRDAVVCLYLKNEINDAPVSSVMSSPLILSLNHRLSISDTYGYMVENGIRHLVVGSDESNIDGIISIWSIFDYLCREYRGEEVCVGSVMRRIVITSHLGEKLIQACEVMVKRNLEYLVVGHNQVPVGILSEWDVISLYDREIENKTLLLDDMVSDLPHSVRVTDSLISAMNIMISLGQRFLKVLDQTGNWVGVISQSDCVRHIFSERTDFDQSVVENKKEQFTKSKLPNPHFEDTLRGSSKTKKWSKSIGCFTGLLHDNEKPAIEDLKSFVLEQSEETALRESELRFRSIFNHAAAGMVMGTSEGCITEVNKAFSDMLGYHCDEMIGMTIQDVTHHDDWEDNRQKIEAVKKGDESTYHLEKRYVTKGGDAVWCLLSAAWLRDNCGKPTHFIALTQNIDEHKRVEEKLHTRVNEWSTLVNTAPIGIGLVVNREIQWVNPRLLEMLGYSEDEVIGKNTRFAYPSDEEYERVGREKYSQIEKYHSGEVEAKLKHKNGSIIDVLLRSTVLDPADYAAGIIFTALDISERKETENALRLFRTLSDKAKDSLFLINVDTASFFDFNHEACRSLGYERSELLKLKVQDINNYFSKTECKWEHFLKSFSSDGELTVEAMHIKKDGSEFPVEINATRLTHHEHEYIIAVARDITERKQTERALQRKTLELEVLLNSIPSPIYLKDNAHRYQAVNSAFVGFVGLDEEDVIGKTDKEIFPQSAAKRCIESDLRVINTKKGINNYEEQIVSENGTSCWFSTTKKPLFDLAGNVEGLVGISFDITENKQDVERRIEEELNLRDTLVLEVHHRIKNHLQGVVGLLRNLSNKNKLLENGLDIAIAQLRTIATVYGLQSRRKGQEIQIRELMQACIDVHYCSTSESIVYNVINSTSLQISKEESVPIALIINELITNALKHRALEKENNKVQVDFECSEAFARLRIHNSSYGLPVGFDLHQGTRLGTGLEIVKSLLPDAGAELQLYEEDHFVVTDLILRSPILKIN